MGYVICIKNDNGSEFYIGISHADVKHGFVAKTSPHRIDAKVYEERDKAVFTMKNIEKFCKRESFVVEYTAAPEKITNPNWNGG